MLKMPILYPKGLIYMLEVEFEFFSWSNHMPVKALKQGCHSFKKYEGKNKFTVINNQK